MISNIDYVYDSSDEITSRLLDSLDEIGLTIPEYFLLLMISLITPCVRSEMIRIAMKISNRNFQVPSDDSLNNALDSMIIKADY